jgi:hypothetical protein
MGFFSLDEAANQPFDDSESWAEATNAYRAALPHARQWQPDARTALTETTEYPPAHVNEEGEWEIYFWSPGQVGGLLIFLSPELELLRQEEWGGFYRDTVVRLANEMLGAYGFSYAAEVSPPGPEGLSFVLRRQGQADQYDFIDVQISTSVMLTPPPRRFTINLVKNKGDRPLFGANGGYEVRLSTLFSTPKPDFWWGFKNEEEYEARLREAFLQTIEFGLPALA